LGRIGVVLDESRETITILEESNEISLGKQSIDFKIGNSDVVINGARVGQRPEDRINKKYRMA
jgi:RNase P/RNase MRP subunit p29